MLIEAIEKKLCSSVPDDFPNRLDSRLLPEDELEYLNQQISKLEDEITDAIRAYRIQIGKGAYADDWLDALAASRTSQQSEFDFISNADFIPRRHFDFGKSLQIAHRRLRMEYLKRLRREV